MLLLEARLAPTTPTTVAKPPSSDSASYSSEQKPGVLQQPITFAPTPITTSVPLAGAGENTESVHSFSSDGVQTAPSAGVAATISARVPPVAPRSAQPPTQGTGAVSTANVRQSKRKAPSTRATKGTNKKQRPSPSKRRNGRVDEFFKPVTPSKPRRPTAEVNTPRTSGTVVVSRAENNVTSSRPGGNGTSRIVGGGTTPRAEGGNAASISMDGIAATERADANAGEAATIDEATLDTERQQRSEDVQSDSDVAGATSGSSVFVQDRDAYRILRRLVDKLTTENHNLRQAAAEIQQLRDENEDLQTQVEIEVPQLRCDVAERDAELEKMKTDMRSLRNALKDSVIQGEQMRRKLTIQTTEIDAERLGHVILTRGMGVGSLFKEVWQDGREWRAIEARLSEVIAEREAIEKLRSGTKKLNKKDDVASDKENATLQSGAAIEKETVKNQDELWEVRLLALRRIEADLNRRQARLALERDSLMRETRRQSDERLSVFGTCPTLKDRYVLLNMLGRGGFSQVFKAMDLDKGVVVACKIHQLSANWGEERRRNFVRHASRECLIHKDLKHPHVVQMLDIFEYDENTLCTVLEFCDGCDLDTYLRTHLTLPEREARCIIAQVFSGLLYLSDPKRRIIHYDLKPANILMCKDRVKITDFGLCKTMRNEELTGNGIELTSQGAGTMWYLPPECFDPADEARINSKVDVWSAGVVLFQMLYGKKPFGHHQTQEIMFREKTVQKEELKFPTSPVVSDAAKEFIKSCLTRNQAARPDVRQVMAHRFLCDD